MSVLIRISVLVWWFTHLAHNVLSAPYFAEEVVSYVPGTGVTLNNPEVALGQPAWITGSQPFDGNWSPFNPHWTADNLVQVGYGGHLSLQMERFVDVSSAGLHLGIWGNTFLAMGSGGRATDPAVMAGVDVAELAVSQNGVDFVSIGEVSLAWFGNYWSDSSGPFSQEPGTIPADFGQPFSAGLADFNGLTYGEILNVLDGTAGGTWIDLSSTGLEKVGWIRFSGIIEGSTVEICAISINSDLAGAVVPEPATGLMLALGFGGWMIYAKKRLYPC